MYQQEQCPGMQRQLAEQQQHCTPSSVPPTDNPFRPSHPLYSSRFEGSALLNQSFGAIDEQRQAQQQSSSCFSFGKQQASSLLTFSGGALSDAIDGAPPAPERRSRAHMNTREHVIAERRRREKMQQQFVALATIVPDLTKVYVRCSCRSL
jgi:hypothetical protein